MKIVLQLISKKKLNFSILSFQISVLSLKNCSKLLTNLRYVTDKRLRTINFRADNIEKIIVSPNPNKAHGHDNNSMYAYA